MKKIVTIVGIILIVLALSLACYTCYRIQNWAKVEGTLVNAEVVTSGSGTSRCYMVVLTWNYQFGGHTYRESSSSVCRGGVGAEAATLKEASSYRIGSTHTIHVNPANPRQMDYQLGFDLESFLLALIIGGIGLVFVLFGFFILPAKPSGSSPSIGIWLC